VSSLQAYLKERESIDWGGKGKGETIRVREKEDRASANSRKTFLYVLIGTREKRKGELPERERGGLSDTCKGKKFLSNRKAVLSLR